VDLQRLSGVREAFIYAYARKVNALSPDCTIGRTAHAWAWAPVL
jgi:hypothetical protein